ncbi:MAG: LD-carboxypeptidase, partial [Desulfomonile tiedjei]|nr:LD-carboxypeptidase [Desulfomonile tiedjei]
FLEHSGFRGVPGRHALERNDYLAGTDDQRSSDLNAMLRDPGIRAIVFARGGYGLMRILESIDYDAITADPKILLGMSDVTALQLSLSRTCNLVTLAGPMLVGQVAAGLDPISEEWLIKALVEPIGDKNLWPGEELGTRVLRPGKASGVLIGGCLSLITALLGTDHSPDFRGKILLVEDVGEPLYRIDRMLTQLKLSGVLADIAGLVLGHFVGPDQTDLAEDVERMALQFTWDNPVPVISRYPHGHRLPNLTLPIGVTVAMDVQSHMLRVGDLPA